MAAIKIPCPKCGAFLKLPGPEYLGRKARCSQCKHRFVLEEPDEVELHLAEPEAPAPPKTRADAPLVGTSPRWVPDDPTEVSSAASDELNLPPMARPLDFGTVPPATAPPAPVVSMPMPTAPAEVSPPVIAGEPGSVAARIQGRRKRNRRGPVLFGIVTAIFVFAMLAVWWNSNRTPPGPAIADKQPPKRNLAAEAQQSRQAESNDDAQKLSPTTGDPIPLNYIAFTPQLILHLRPAELWANDRDVAEFRALLGEQFIVWLEGKIQDVTHFQPQQISELTFAVNFGPRGSPADVGAVVRLKDPLSNSDLIRAFGGQIRTDLSAEVYESGAFSYIIADEQTFAVAPAGLSEALASAKQYPALALVDLQPLLEQSDRNRHATVLFDVSNLDDHRQDIFIEQLQPLADQFVLWFGKDIQTVSWSFHLDRRYFFMETLLHQSNTSSPARVQRYMESQLEKLPGQMYSAVRGMQPSTVGSKTLIGRFPAMLAAMTLGTSSHVGQNYVRLVTLLPDVAGANLAGAAALTWNQSVATASDTSRPPVAATDQLPNTVAERLQMPILIDFRRTPLQEAFAYIGEEISTPVNIIGEDLELAGITQVMAQTFNLGEVPAVQAIDAILQQYKGVLVISVDEASKTITLTTRDRAKEKGLPIFETSQ
ncbi:MAG: hypothetical protein R3C19_14845 [Planctomycetaceae bacterium]